MKRRTRIKEGQKQTIAGWKRMLHGYLLGLVLISIFIFGVDQVPEDWGPYWRLKPLIITPLAGALAGLFFYLADRMEVESQWLRKLILLFAFIGYFIALWLGLVLGLNGTMWD